MLPSDIAVVDTETMGLNPDRHPIWEIAVIVDGDEHCWQHKAYGGNRGWREWVDPWVLENTRVATDYDPDAAMTEKQSIDRFVELTRGKHLAGMCIAFDSERLHRVWRAFHQTDWQMPWHYHLIDVEAVMFGYLSSLMAPDHRTRVFPVGHEIMSVDPIPWKSVDLSRALGVDPADFEPKHTALADARWAKACLEAVWPSTAD